MLAMPTMLWVVAEHATRLFNRQQRLIDAEAGFELDMWEDLGHQFGIAPAHAGVGGGDDKHFGAANAGLEAEATALGDVAGIHVAPEVPLARMWVVLPVFKACVVVRLHDIGEAQADIGRPAPAGNLPGHLLADEFGEGVAALGGDRLFIDWGHGRWATLKRQPQHRLTRGPDDARHAEYLGGAEDVVGRAGVGAEHDLLGAPARIRIGG